MLYIVATPIGNLEDISFRAVRILREAKLIACEDTRHVRKLLDHYNIETPAISYHEHNEAERTQDLLERLKRGDTIALVSDAGTPLVSDPGYRLVRAVTTEGGIPVVAIPGASACLAGLAVSGLATDQFRFCGFLPAKTGQRKRLLESLKDDPGTLIFYEAPHRLVESLQDVVAAMGRSRPVAVARELTKLHEETVRGSAGDVLADFTGRTSVKGEITLLIGKAEELVVDDERTLAEAVAALVGAGMERMDAIKHVARERGLSKRDVYRELNVANGGD